MSDSYEECEICFYDHRTAECDVPLCGKCWEVVRNCECKQTEEVSAAEWVDAGRPNPASWMP